MRNFSLLAVPAWEPGRGGGHLIRQTELVRELRKKGACAWLYLPQAALSAAREGGLSGGPPFPGLAELLIDEAGLERGPFSLIVLDRFKTPPGEWKRWSALGPTAALDEGGRREEADFLIDLLPAPPGRQGPNLSAPWLLPLPRRRRPSFAPPPDGTGKIRILISFGAEDRAGLSVPAALALARSGLPSLDLTVVFGPLRRAPLLSAERAALERAGVRVIEALRGEGGAAGSAANSAAINADALPLRETLADYDLVITHFGLTAFEALHARVPALLVSPTARHERLARHAGLLSAGTG
ncbi:MAG: hypothetical protein LBQ44_01905, partial [Treponema sp.]|nr:hypothetical protein [Treponema sp.]